MDSILLLGGQDPKLSSFLSKMGYAVLEPHAGQPLADLLHNKVVDLIVLDTSFGVDAVELCSFFRSSEQTDSVPIVCLTNDKQQIEGIKANHTERVEFLATPYSVGSLASKIAVQLRLRKFAGADNLNARLGEMNAALRDLNQHFQKQMEEARAIQQSLLPESLPQDPRFDIAVAYQPLEGVGGDWYYFANEANNKLSFQVADATGHGLSAAFLCSMTKLARSAAQFEEPHKVLSEMNRLIANVIPQGMFVGASSFIYDPSNGALSYSRAGMPPVLFVERSTQTVHRLKAGGLALGMIGDAEYESDNVVLQAGDALLIFTDGIPEGQNLASKVYGYDRMADVLLKSSPQLSSADLLQAVLDDFENFLEGRLLKDDVTAILFRRMA